MKTASVDGSVPVAVPDARRRVYSDFLALTKPRVNLLVLMTTLIGFHLGTFGPIDIVMLVHTVIGTALVAGGAAALNQVLERDIDRLMRRTQSRPLPAGRLGIGEAGWFALVLAGLGLRRARVGAQPARGAGGVRDDRQLCARLHAAQEPDVAGHGDRRRARGAAADDRLGGGDGQVCRSKPGCCLRSCSSGRCRTCWRSRGCTARTTSAAASACCPSRSRTARARRVRRSATRRCSFRSACCRRSSGSRAACTCIGALVLGSGTAGARDCLCAATHRDARAPAVLRVAGLSAGALGADACRPHLRPPYRFRLRQYPARRRSMWPTSTMRTAIASRSRT